MTRSVALLVDVRLDLKGHTMGKWWWWFIINYQRFSFFDGSKEAEIAGFFSFFSFFIEIDP